MSGGNERTMIARQAAHESWAHTVDRSARTANARAALMARFEREVDLDGTLPPQERAKRAESARKAYFGRLALKSAQVRRGQKAPTAKPAQRVASTTPADDLVREAYAWATASPSPLVTEPSGQARDKPVALYRHFDMFGQLLYVGITLRTSSRLANHAATSQWVQFADHEAAVWYPSRAEAEKAEREAIEIEKPIFNKIYAPADRAQRVVSYLLARGATDLLASGAWS